MDLHGYYKDESIRAVSEFIREVKEDLNECNEYRRKVMIITGRGNGSKNGPVLRPAVESHLTDLGYNPHLCEGEGAFTIIVENESSDDSDSYYGYSD